MLIKSIFTNSSGILFSRILGFIRDLLTASILGANIYSDIFFVAFKLPNLFRRIFAEGAFTQAFIPAYAKAKHKIQFSSSIFLSFFAFIMLLSVFVTLFAEMITHLIALGFDSKTVDLAAPLLAINFYYLPMIFVVTFMAALLQYKNHFATTAFSTALLNLALIAALLISKDLDKYEITYYMSYGVLAGGLLQILVHIIAMKNNNLLKIFTFKKFKLAHNKFYKNFAAATLGSSTAHLSAFLDTFLASFLITGSISYMYYANRIFQLPLALFAIATSVALFPMIAKAIKNNNETKALELMRKSTIILSILLSISTLIGIIFNEFIISLLFEHGAFTSADTSNTALILAMYLIALIPFGIAKIFSLWLYAHEQQFIGAKISIKALTFNIIFSLILIKPYGAAGLAFASTISGFVLFFLTIKEFGFKKFYLLMKNN
ncbi:MAG: murein biosynthesis integral membrane protein MurJ [Campylobacterales bacterium]|nr:murein biosynthesis integral membrane protein MurJ [Campylobacterales bacterium]